MRPIPRTRRQVLQTLARATAVLGLPTRALAAPPPPAPGAWTGRTDPAAITIDLPQLRYPGTWSPRSGAMRVLARELRLRTRLEPKTEPTTVEATSPLMFETPFLYIAGDGGLPDFKPEGELALRRFIDLGGLILFDAADGGTDPTFTADVRKLLERISPASTLAPVSREHVIYRSFYLVDFPWGRTQSHEELLGIQEEGRLKVILNRNDLGGALAETDEGLSAHPCTPGGAEQREWAVRFGVNILLYATCTDYKGDRAHVETLLRSRRWK